MSLDMFVGRFVGRFVVFVFVATELAGNLRQERPKSASPPAGSKSTACAEQRNRTAGEGTAAGAGAPNSYLNIHILAYAQIQLRPVEALQGCT